MLDPEFRVTISLGCASTEHVVLDSALLQAGDRALYRAKGMGRNRSEVGQVLADPTTGLAEQVEQIKKDGRSARAAASGDNPDQA